MNVEHGALRAAPLVDGRDDDVTSLRALPEERPAVVAIPGAPSRLTIHVAISAGAVLGASARLLIGEWGAATWGTSFPWSTLLINVTGSLILGFYLALVMERFTGRYTVRLFFATGTLGAYTTFSTFSYEAVELYLNGNGAGAAVYVIATMVLGLAGVSVGMLAAHAL